MRLRLLHQALAITLFLGAASMAAAQTSSSSGSTSASPPPAAPASSASHHASKHAASGMRHGHAKTGASHEAESPYQAALKRCVEGPAGQRDNCIDQAIDQYSRS
ncbi:MAG TPA: hypothetical protein VGI14_10875 [Casimicrobiaceae bacterium]